MTSPNDQPQDARTAGTPAPGKTVARAPFPVAHWVAGTVLALAGGLAARFVAPGLADPARGFAAATGHAAAGLGLLVIALGVRKRVWAANAAAANTDAENAPESAAPAAATKR
jgi:hypothetical protein